MRIARWLDKHFEEVILVILLIAISCVMMLQIIMRKVFNSSLSWPEEFCRYCYVWTTFMTLSFTMRYGNILRVGVLVDIFPHVAKKLTYLLGNVACLIFFAAFFFNSIDVVQSIYASGQKSTAMGLPMYLVYTCTVLGFFLGTIRTIQVIIDNIKNFNVRDKKRIDEIKQKAEEEAAAAKADLEKAKIPGIATAQEGGDKS